MAIELNRLNEEVYFAADPIVVVGRDDIEHLKRLALATKRGRVRLCAHQSIDSRLHEMLIVHSRDAYVRPHKHLDKAESFHLIEGVVDVVFFDEGGAVEHVVHMENGTVDSRFFYRISGPRYHTLLIRSEFIVFHEATSGPFIREQTAFAPWAPSEDDVAGQAAFLRIVEERVRRLIAARRERGDE